ncbi:hypothetical protein KY308_01375 [Candidatus Woesearchaeota archaeon]|nr:hypothetical protein [Candidatus Woesearchaeota archaeon]
MANNHINWAESAGTYDGGHPKTPPEEFGVLLWYLKSPAGCPVSNHMDKAYSPLSIGVVRNLKKQNGGKQK